MGTVAVVWLNGELLEERAARLSALDRGVLWGQGLFETLRAYGGKLWAFDEHYRRLQAGAKALELAVPAPGEVRAAMAAVMEANGLADCGVRVTVTAGAGPPDPHADPDAPPNVLVTAWPVRDYSRLWTEGADLVTVEGFGRGPVGVKTTSYAASVAGRLAARRAGADDALFVTADGMVLETTGSNVLGVWGGELVTPPVSAGVLPGVTRGVVLELARSMGLGVREEPVSLVRLLQADEVLLTSTLREVYAARSVDGRPVRRGPLAGRLRAALREAILRAVGGEAVRSVPSSPPPPAEGG